MKKELPSGVDEATPEPLDNPLYLFNNCCEWVVNTIKQNLLGKVLTIIDSAIQDERQNKAIKDLIKNTIWEDKFCIHEFKDIIQQYVEKYQPEMSKYLTDLKIKPHPARTYFKENE